MALTPDTPDKLERTGPDEHKRYRGRFLGYVRDNLDPERRGRVRVYCPEVMGEVDEPDRWLGFAEAVAPGSGFDQGLFMVPTMPEDAPRDDGDATSPYNSTRVWISFRDGDPAKPIYDQGGPWIGGELIQNHAPVLSDVDNSGDESIARPNGTASSIKFEVNLETGELFEGTTVDEPVPSNQAAYPRNTVWKTSGGSIVEFDDTPGGERIKIFHPSGSYFEINQSGSLIQRTTGKKIEFVSDERFSSIRGPSTEVYQATQHLQVDRSSTNIYRDSRVVVTEKGEKRFNRAGVEHTIAGLLSMDVGSYTLESIANLDLIAGSSLQAGADLIDIQGRESRIMGSEVMEVIGFDRGVRLVGKQRSPVHKIYAQRLVGDALSAADTTLRAVLNPKSVTTMNGLAVVDFLTFNNWRKGVEQAVRDIKNAFQDNQTVHGASKD